jgi:hypothetical protein
MLLFNTREEEKWMQAPLFTCGESVMEFVFVDFEARIFEESC